MVFTTSAAGVNLLKEFEGLRLDAYRCPAGKWTIGYGATALPNGQPVTPGMMITPDRAEKLLSSDLQRFERMVHKLVTNPDMTQNQFDALVCFVYNVGPGNLGSSTLLRKFNEGDVAGAAKEFDRWNISQGKPLVGLTRRRAAERALFEGKAA